MKYVQPIREMDLIEKLKVIFKKQNYRNYFLFIFGINSGLRISDILRLKVSDVRNKTHVVIIEKKTGKEKRFKLNTNLQTEVKEYISNMSNDEYLFTPVNGKSKKPISREMAWIILNKAAKELGLEEIGTHTLRKTFGYHFYQKTKDVALLQNIFNHSSPSVTLRYIGINQDIIDNALDEFNL